MIRKNQKEEQVDEEVIEEIIAYDDEEGLNKDGDIDNNDFNGDEDEFEISNFGGENKDDDEFDRIVGALQDIVIDETFEKLQKDFYEKNCLVFEEKEENKFEYMTIFKDYQKTIESYIEKKLKEMIPDIDFKKFLKLLETRSEQIDILLLEMLLSFTDFQLFKELMLSHKKSIEAKNAKLKAKKVEESKTNSKDTTNKKTGKITTVQSKPAPATKTGKVENKVPETKKGGLTDEFGDLMISGKKTVIHKEEDSDGEERPDLQLEIIPIPTPKKTTNKANPKAEPLKKK